MEVCNKGKFQELSWRWVCVCVWLNPVGAKNCHGCSLFLSKVHFFSLPSKLCKSIYVLFKLQKKIILCWIHFPTEEKIRKPAAIVRHSTYSTAVQQSLWWWWCGQHNNPWIAEISSKMLNDFNIHFSTWRKPNIIGRNSVEYSSDMKVTWWWQSATKCSSECWIRARIFFSKNEEVQKQRWLHQCNLLEISHVRRRIPWDLFQCYERKSKIGPRSLWRWYFKTFGESRCVSRL